eukprot:TRINITY_DN18642_c0_g1_i2.p1 TRINITY_DN18642_c0_g1~~TRINITY_DN18642_c0_g1_i2.p1  ORF type:complete len:1234 (+),score=310.52 TRINITY_DN18642_c0_g1_i2:98-3799(+)
MWMALAAAALSSGSAAGGQSEAGGMRCPAEDSEGSGGVYTLVQLLVRVMQLLGAAAVGAAVGGLAGYLQGLRAGRAQSTCKATAAAAGQLQRARKSGDGIDDYTQALRELHAAQLLPAARSGGDEALWLTALAEELWPHIEAYVEDLLTTTVQPLIRDSLPVGFVGRRVRFSRASLGAAHPIMGPVRSRRLPEGGVELFVGVVYHGDCDIVLDAGVCSIGAREITLAGTMAVSLRTPLPRLPFIGGLDLAFVNRPTIEMEWTGLGSLADAPLLSGAVRSAVNSAVASLCVMPNRIAVPFSWTDPAVIRAQLRCPVPVGVLRVTVLRASGLPPRDVSRGRVRLPSAHVAVRLGDQQGRTAPEPRSAEPEWSADNTVELTVHSLEQVVDIDVYDGGTLLGAAPRLCVAALARSGDIAHEHGGSASSPPSPTGAGPRSCSRAHTVTLQTKGDDKAHAHAKGTLTFTAELLELSTAEEPPPTRRGAGAQLLSLRVDEVSGLAPVGDATGPWSVHVRAAGVAAKSWDGWAPWVDGGALADRVATVRRLPGSSAPHSAVATAAGLPEELVARMPPGSDGQTDGEAAARWRADAAGQRMARLMLQRPQFEQVLRIVLPAEWDDVVVTLVQRGDLCGGGFRIPRSALRLAPPEEGPEQLSVVTEVLTPRGTAHPGPARPARRVLDGPFEVGTQGARLHGAIELHALRPADVRTDAAAGLAAAAARQTAQWVRDKDAKACMACCSPFTLTRRRHHCRKCGIVVCESCSPARLRLPGYNERQRVCRRCERERFRQGQGDGPLPMPDGDSGMRIEGCPLAIEVLQGRRVLFSTFAPIVSVSYDGDERNTAPVGGLNPQWNERFEFAAVEATSSVALLCRDLAAGHFLGCATFDPLLVAAEAPVRAGRRRVERWVEWSGDDQNPSSEGLGSVLIVVDLRADVSIDAYLPRTRSRAARAAPRQRGDSPARSESPRREPRSPLSGSPRGSPRGSPQGSPQGSPRSPMLCLPDGVDSGRLPGELLRALSTTPSAFATAETPPEAAQPPPADLEMPAAPPLPPPTELPSGVDPLEGTVRSQSPSRESATSRPRGSALAMPPSLAGRSEAVQVELGVIAGHNLSGLGSAKTWKFQCEVTVLGAVGQSRFSTAVATEQQAAATAGGASRATVRWGDTFRARVQRSGALRVAVRHVRAVGKEVTGGVEVRIRDVLDQASADGSPAVLPFPVITAGEGTTGGVLDLSLRVIAD